MKISKFLTFCLGLLLFISSTSFAQQRQMAAGGAVGAASGIRQGKISGLVIDKSTGKPVEYANIAVCKISDSSVVTGGITNEQGKFLIEKVPYGNYKLKIRFIGYSTSVMNNIKVSQAITDVGKVDLHPSTQNLAEVTVTGRKSEVQNNLDKKVYNIDKTMYGTGGTAIDIMQSLPAVQVDFDGNVSMRGSSVTILIDGRPSNLVSLDQMPAHLIERVEVISNPSAKYDPEGVSGIINIVLKKNVQKGLNGMVNLNIGLNDKYMGSATVNYRHNKINYFVNYTLRSFHMDDNQETWTKTGTDNSYTYRAENSTSPRSMNMQNIQGGIDYFINDKNVINTSFTLEPRDMNSQQNAAGFIDRYANGSIENLYNYTRYTSSSNTNKGGYEYDLNYKKTFSKEGEELTAELNIDKGNNKSEQASIQKYTPIGSENYLTPYSNQITNTTNDNTRSFVRVDYVLPMAEKGRLETGYMLTLNNSDMDNNVSKSFAEGVEPTPLPVYDDSFTYRMWVNALYFNYGLSVGKFKMQVGLRGENAKTHGNETVQNSSFDKTYRDLFPSAFIKYAPNEKDEFGINYSRRTNRPRTWALNPFENRSDSLNISKGNPELNPEYVNSFELGYTRMFGKKNSISLTAFYRKTTGVIASVREQISPLQTFTTYTNLNSSETYGGEAATNMNIFKWWSVNANYSYFHVKLTDKTDSILSNNNKESDSWTLRVNSSWFITKKLTAQLMYNYSSPVVSVGGGFHGGVQGKTLAAYGFDAGLRYVIFNGKGEVSFRMRDIFNTWKYRMDGYGPGYTSYTKSWRDYPNMFVGFTYRLNDFKRKQQKQDNMDMEESM